MNFAKSLLLGSAAGLIAVAGAEAADLPTKKAAPVDYVRICNVYGPGFFYIPGTDTCIKIGGKAEFDLEWDEPRAHSDPTVGYNALARVNLDARTATDWGLLRTFGADRHPPPFRRVVWLWDFCPPRLRCGLRRRRQPQ